MSTSRGSRGERNRILLALSGAEYERLLPSLETLSIPAGRVLYQAHQAITSLYFPQRSVVSILMADDDGGSVEVQTIGNEGIVGLGAFLGGRTVYARTVARVPDHAMKMSAVAFRSAVRGSKPLRRVLLRYTQTVVSTLARATLCQRQHRIEARCAYCLLLTHDRVGADRFLLTQSALAQMVGVRRPTLVTAAVALRRAGLIRYARGRMTILDRGGLEAAACSCYAILRAEYELLFGPDRRSAR